MMRMDEATSTGGLADFHINMVVLRDAMPRRPRVVITAPGMMEADRGAAGEVGESGDRRQWQAACRPEAALIFSSSMC